MIQQPAKSQKKVSRKIIVFAIVALSPVILWGLFFILTQLTFLPIRVEINRIESMSGIKTSSVECDSGIDTGIICRALYNKLTYAEHFSMLANSGYTIEATPNDGSNSISAINSKVHIVANGGPGYEGSGFEGKTSITFQLNGF